MRINKFFLNKFYINCLAIAENYRVLQQYVGNKVICAATVKSNAYNLGVTPIMLSLSKAGCSRFFVSTIDEAIELRNNSLTDEIYVLNGIFAGEEVEFAQHNLIPVLNTRQQFELLNNYCRKKDKRLDAILNIDTGTNLLGFPAQEAIDLAKQNYFQQKVNICFIMSHLACASNPSSPYNQEQLVLARQLQKIFKKPISLADSSGICLGVDYHFDMVRPGIMLYGVKAVPSTLDLQPVITVTSPIIQMREVTEDLLVGYDNSQKVSKGTILATIPIGYADGLPSLVSDNGTCYINGDRVPIVGKVSMDRIVIDVTKVPKNNLYLGVEVEILGKNATIEKIASGNIVNCHEIFTSLGSHLHKIYQQ